MSETVVLPIIVIAVLVAVNGVFVAAEFAMVAARQRRLDTMAKEGNRAARWLLAVFEKSNGKDDYVAVAQLGITLASIGLGMYGEPAVAHWLLGPFESWGMSEGAAHSVAFVVALSGITYMHVVFGEMIPKGLALRDPEVVGVGVNPIMRASSILFKPVVWVLSHVATLLMRIVGIREPDHRRSIYSTAELEYVTDESADRGELGDMQRDLIHNALDLEDRTAEELMTSRSHIEWLDAKATRDEVSERIAASNRSRYPVTEGSLDDVIGMLHIKDFIRATERKESLDLRDLVRPLPRIQASAHGDFVLELFRTDRTHAALVVDEFGGTLGLVTMDDVIAEVMDDEFQLARGDLVTNEDGSMIVDGETTLARLAEDLHVDIKDDRVTTIAGVVLATTLIMPEAGESVQVPGYELTVEAMEHRKITLVRIRPLAPSGDGDENGSGAASTDGGPNGAAKDDSATDGSGGSG